jgi:hypothetical protein
MRPATLLVASALLIGLSQASIADSLWDPVDVATIGKLPGEKGRATSACTFAFGADHAKVKASPINWTARREPGLVSSTRGTAALGPAPGHSLQLCRRVEGRV